MLLNRIYDEQDLGRFKAERQEKTETWQATFREIGVPDDLAASFAKQLADRQTVPPLTVAVDVRHTGFKPEQNFSTSLITDFLKAGIVEIDGDRLTLRASPEDLHYTVKRTPGRWCLHCGEKLPDDQNGELARLHIAMQHPGAPSPDESNPAGYVWLTYFECVLDEKQHEKLKKGS